MQSFLLLIVFCTINLFAVSSCSSGSSDDSNGGSSIAAAEISSEGFRSLCGLVEDDSLRSVPDQLESVRVEVVGSDTLIIERTEGKLIGQRQLVKLHGISSTGVSSLRILHGIDILKKRLSEGGFFVPAGRECDVVSAGGGLGILGQVFSRTGENMSELMLLQGSALPSADICEGETLRSCYETIAPEQRFPSEIELAFQDVSLASRCGVVKQGALHNPILGAELVKVEALSSDVVQVTRLLGLEQGNSQLVMLQGVSSEGVSANRQALGRFLINSELSPEAYLVVEDFSCSVNLDDGGVGVTGALFTKSGESITDMLLQEGFVLPASGLCNDSFLFDCHGIIAAEAPAEVLPPTSNPDAPESSADVIDDFLWKPSSERTGDLVILVNPTGVKVVVIGSVKETLTDFGPSNGRGTTARANRSGCAFGSNVTVEFFNSQGERIPLKDGRTSVNIADGCKRVEFKL